MNNLAAGNLLINANGKEQSEILTQFLTGSSIINDISTGENINPELGSFEQLLNGLSGFMPSQNGELSNVQNLVIGKSSNSASYNNYNLHSSLTSLNEDLSSIQVNQPFTEITSRQSINTSSKAELPFTDSNIFDDILGTDEFIYKPKDIKITPVTNKNLGAAVGKEEVNVSKEESHVVATPSLLQAQTQPNNEYSNISNDNGLPSSNKESLATDKEDMLLQNDPLFYPTEEFAIELTSLPLRDNYAIPPAKDSLMTSELNTEEATILAANGIDKAEIKAANYNGEKSNNKVGQKSAKLVTEPTEGSQIRPTSRLGEISSDINTFTEAEIRSDNAQDFDKEDFQDLLGNITPGKINKYSTISKTFEGANSPSTIKYDNIIDQVSMRVSNAIKTGQTKIQVELSPQELGRIEISLEVDAMGNKRIEILSEKFTTFDILQSSVKDLESALSALNGEDNSTSLNFGLKDHQQQQHRGHQGNNFNLEETIQGAEDIKEIEYMLISHEGKEDNVNILA